MADAPERYDPPQPQAQIGPQYSTLEPIHHGATNRVAEGLEVHYQPNHEYYKPVPQSDFLYNGEINKNGNANVYVAPVVEAKGKRRICGMSAILFWALVALLILGGIGAIVGGVVGSRSSSDKAPASQTSSAAPSTSTTASSATSTTAAPSATAAAQFKPDYWYRLTNSFLGPLLALDINNSDGQNSVQLNMSDTGDHQGQFWQIRHINGSTDDAPVYHLACMYLGQQKRLSVSNETSILPRMAAADDSAAGQKWTFTEWDDGTWAVGNLANGKGWNMSTYRDTHVLFMRSDGEDDGQHWSAAQMTKITLTGWEVD